MVRYDFKINISATPQPPEMVRGLPMNTVFTRTEEGVSSSSTGVQFNRHLKFKAWVKDEVKDAFRKALDREMVKAWVKAWVKAVQNVY